MTFLENCEIISDAVGATVSSMFNVTPPEYRVVMLAALHMSTEAAVSTLGPQSRAAYDAALENMQVTCIKHKKKEVP